MVGWCAENFVLEDRKRTRAQEMCSKPVACFWKALPKEFLDFEYSNLNYYFPSLSNSSFVHIIFMVLKFDMLYIYVFVYVSVCVCTYIVYYIYIKLHLSSPISRLHTVTTVRKSSAVLEIHQEV